MATNRAHFLAQRCLSQSARGSAFTLIDLLVSMAIIAVLISLLLPTLSGVREATRRVVCMSNVRQQGLCLSMFLEDNNGQMPESQYLLKDPARGIEASPQNMNIVRTDGATSADPAVWDGLGILFQKEYINSPQVYYCPSHRGSNPYANYAAIWHEDTGKIVTNFQFRGAAASASSAAPQYLSLLTDGLATQSDYSHSVGCNVLRGDFSVAWRSDPGGAIFRSLPMNEGDAQAASAVNTAWSVLDSPAAAQTAP